ncbi:MAG: DUF1565 domain-containing protein [Clostridiales bacterium]|jgi:hypothetical protein|nr:DUF1565 domain-containing protein [Clostridiales bacterium]
MKVIENVSEVIEQLTPYAAHSNDSQVHLTHEEKDSLKVAAENAQLGLAYNVHQFLGNRHLTALDKKLIHNEIDATLYIKCIDESTEEGVFAAGIDGSNVAEAMSNAASYINGNHNGERVLIEFSKGTYRFSNEDTNLDNTLQIFHNNIVLYGQDSVIFKMHHTRAQEQIVKMINVYGSNIVICNIEFVMDTSTSYNVDTETCAINLNGSGCIVEGCEFTNFTKAIISNFESNTIMGNYITRANVGIEIGTSSLSRLETIAENTIADCDIGIVAHGKNAKVIGNIIKNTRRKSIEVQDSEDSVVAYNAIFDMPIEVGDSVVGLITEI